MLIKEPIKHFPDQNFIEDVFISYFDGASKEGYCGHLWLGCGEGWNKWEKMMDLQGLLIFASNKNFLSLQVSGYSKVIVD